MKIDRRFSFKENQGWVNFRKKFCISEKTLEFQWLKPSRIIDSVKEYDAPKFLRQEKRAERTDFAKKCEKRTYFIDCLWLEG